MLLENEFMDSTKYVSIDKIFNYNTYSDFYTKLFLSIGSEIDVICKDYCSFIDKTKSPDNIMGYNSIIISHDSGFCSRKIIMKNTNTTLIPWECWTTKPPTWWKIYNKVKHQRTEGLTVTQDNKGIKIDINDLEYTKYTRLVGNPYYVLANQENVLLSLSGLFQLCMEFYYDVLQINDYPEERRSPIPDESSKIFELEGRVEPYLYFMCRNPEYTPNQR
jgi:hypothetical protein